MNKYKIYYNYKHHKNSALRRGNIEFEIKDGVLIKYRGDKEHAIIPDNVTEIFANENSKYEGPVLSY